ncbi:MAG TPA: hypothetical protein VFA40_06735 [Terriglobales bacterium]|nr:hypothetical protein [Terriglobales bacterium]
MNFGPRSIAFGALFCISSLLAVAQQTPCSTDGQTPAPGAIACVTGNGVIVTANTPVDAQQEVMPLTPEQRPAAAPVVIYLNGKLSISAKNSTLGDVLRAIANKTGAAIDVPENANERVVSQLGPALPRDVMASLLNGSHFNYVMVGTENDPNSVARVVLTAKSDKGETGNGTAVASNGSNPVMMNGRPMVQPRTALQAAVMQPYQDMLAAQQAQQEAAENQQSIEPAAPASDAIPPSNSAAAAAPASGSADNATVEPPPAPEAPRAGNGSGEKTPAQVLQDLYETRRQMMEKQQHPQPQQ